jgi:hypothetical protein
VRETSDVVDLGPLPPSGPWRLEPGRAVRLDLPGPVAIDRIALRLQQLFWAGVGLFLYALLLTGRRGKRFFSKKDVTSDDPSLD